MASTSIHEESIYGTTVTPLHRPLSLPPHHGGTAMPFIPRTVIQTSTDGEAWDDLVPGVLGKGSLVAVDLTVALSQQLDRLAASGPGVPLGALIGPADVGQEGNLVE